MISEEEAQLRAYPNKDRSTTKWDEDEDEDDHEGDDLALTKIHVRDPLSPSPQHGYLMTESGRHSSINHRTLICMMRSLWHDCDDDDAPTNCSAEDHSLCEPNAKYQQRG